MTETKINTRNIKGWSNNSILATATKREMYETIKEYRFCIEKLLELIPNEKTCLYGGRRCNKQTCYECYEEWGEDDE